MKGWMAAAMVALAAAGPARAEEDELRPVPPAALQGKSYPGVGPASEIRFINARLAPVAVSWIAFDGSVRRYAVIPPGGEWLQPTFVTHRWLVQDGADGPPLAAFISTRAAIHADGVPQIALIR